MARRAGCGASLVVERNPRRTFYHMTHPRLLRLLSALGAAAVAAVAAVAAASCRDAPLHGVAVADPYPAPSLAVTMASGSRYVLAADTGKLVLLYFGYTSCPDYCPMMLRDWKRAKESLGALADGVRFVFVSVDPERDTPAGTDAYARRYDPAFIGLAPPPAQLDSIKTAWNVTAYKEAVSPGAAANRYSVAHPAHAFLVNRAGRVQVMYPPETLWQDLAADLKRMR